MSSQRQDIRRMRNRTLSGVENMRMVGGIPTATAGGMLGDPHHLQRPGSAGGLVGGSRPITPSFSNDKDPGQQFVDFNPAGIVTIIARFKSYNLIFLDETQCLYTLTSFSLSLKQTSLNTSRSVIPSLVAYD